MHRFTLHLGGIYLFAILPLITSENVNSWSKLTTLFVEKNNKIVYSPIHATRLPTGKILLLGFTNSLTRCSQNTFCGSQNKAFLFDPLIPERPLEPLLYRGKNWNEGTTVCAGHLILANGEVAHFGGNNGQTFVRYMSTDKGIFYGSLARRSPLGRLYYSTATQIRDGLVFVYANLAAGAAFNEAQHYNDAAALFNYSADMVGKDPWEVMWTQHDAQEDPRLLLLRSIGYTAVWNLKRPITMNNILYDLLAIGDAFVVVLLSSFNSGQRYIPPNSQRPDLNGQAPTCNYKVFGYPSYLMIESGEVAVGGGCYSTDAASKIHVYNPEKDSWRSIDLGFARAFATFVLLPDSTALLVNGFGHDAQIINFTAETVINFPADNRTRGYHNYAILAEDGRVVVGGGLGDRAEIGCEWPNIRFFSPPYLDPARARPAFITYPDFLSFEDEITFTYLGDVQRVVAMTLPSVTHQIDTNTRIVRLTTVTQTASKIVVRFPKNTESILEVLYTMYLISKDETPSIGLTIRLRNQTTDLDPAIATDQPDQVCLLELCKDSVAPGCTCETTHLTVQQHKAAVDELVPLMRFLTERTVLVKRTFENGYNQTDINITNIYLGHVLRLAFHDAAEYDAMQKIDNFRADGCLNVKDPANQGLQAVIDLLQPLWLNHCTKFSRADFWNLAAIVALQYVAPSGNYPIRFAYGRRDQKNCTMQTLGRLPNPNGGFDETKRVFVTQMNLPMRYAITLLGGHALKGSSVFDNHFFQDLFNLSWTKIGYENNATGWIGKNASIKTMLNTDVSLLYKHTSSIQINQTCNYEEKYNCIFNNEIIDSKNVTASMLIEMYARNNTLFLSDFEEAFFLMTSAGYDNLATQLLTASTNDMQLWEILTIIASVVLFCVFAILIYKYHYSNKHIYDIQKSNRYYTRL